MSKPNKLALNPIPEDPKVSILCLDISNFSQKAQFCICTFAVFVLFILYGFLQERIFTIPGFQPFGWHLTLVQFALCSAFGLVETRARKIRERRIPLATYAFLALLTLGTMGFSNASLGYLNYPTQVIFKCCKLLPVMAGSILIQGKRYGPLDFCAAMLMCIGLTLFTLADSQVQPNFDTRGIFMISMALLCDAMIGNVQEKYMKLYMAANSEVVLYSYFIGFLYLLTTLIVTGDLLSGIYFFGQNPWEVYSFAFLFSLTGYLGTQIVLTLVRTCGAFAAVTVTTCRKAVTIVVSFIFFSKPFTLQYLWSGLLIVLGIYLNLFAKKYKLSFSDLELRIEHCLKYIALKVHSRKYDNHYMSEV